MTQDSLDTPVAACTTFPSTHWSLVLRATTRGGDEGDRALESLCAGYWFPLYAYVRRKGYAPADAEDLTQEFFSRLLHRNYLSSVDREKGRFRSFLLASLEHFLAKEWNRAHRVKRGGRHEFISFEEHALEERYHQHAQHHATPEVLYDQAWAVAILEKAMERLGAEYAAAGKDQLFGRLKGFLSGERDPQGYAQAAACLQLSPGATRVAVHRLRNRFGQLVRAEIGETVSHAEQVDEEIRELILALGRTV